MSLKRQDIKFRADAATERRLKWAGYCTDKSNQELIQDALDRLFVEIEKTYGPPVQPKGALENPSQSRESPRKQKMAR